MSFTSYPQAKPRLHRSELAVPASQPKFFEKAAASEADAVFLDLEDAVAPDEKDQARKNAIQALNDIDWGEHIISVRINGLDTHYMYRDVVDVVEQAGGALDMIVIPKVGTAADVYALDMLVTQIEQAKGLARRIGFSLIIETALGMANVQDIAGASPRNEALNFGVADFAASTRMRLTDIGGASPDYTVLTGGPQDLEREVHWNDVWHYGLARIVVAGRARGLRVLDGPYGDFNDPEGYRAAARRAATLGCDGKWAIHPKQVALANEVMSPRAEEVRHAERVLEAMAAATAAGQGAVALDGRLIDIASIRHAEALVQTARRIEARKPASRAAGN